MSRWLIRNLAIVNIVLVFLSFISYMVTINKNVSGTHWVKTFWTEEGEQITEIGGVLNYQMFGQSTIYHVTRENKIGEPNLSFLDITSYLLLALVVFNGAALFLRGLRETEPGGLLVRKLAARNFVLGILCTFLYFWTMMFIEHALSDHPPIGGVVGYSPFVSVDVTHVFEGHIESFPNWRFADFTSWLLLALFISTLFTIRRQLSVDD